ncbi:AvrE-family type 3 secretion system effector [Pseudomonas sp. NFR16]|uniref:AvrE-family type 3 secretion system effector n=1 Tax=Pseudomonas sp. NFR16 TaxID=1566248 RepID=UPI0008C6C5A7|nr:AvrE-family type 3 secretion system effector [Pseudomonas sp. NFR16]SEI67955.1 Pathogenicity factor [Pseudomonas sp. NFR16]
MPLQFLPSRSNMQQLGAAAARHDARHQRDGTELMPLGVSGDLRVAVRNGQVELTAPTGELAHACELLSQILNKPGQAFAHHQRDGRLVDGQGFVVMAGANPHTVYAFVSSRSHHAGSGAAPVGRFDKAHLAQKTGLFEGANASVWTLHDKRLHRLADGLQWHAATLPGGHGGQFKALTQKDDDVYALDEQGQAWKLGGEPPTQVPFAHPVSALTAHGEDWLGVTQQGGTYRLQESGTAGRSTELTIGHVPVGDRKADKPSAIATAGTTLFMVDGGGRLHVGTLPARRQWSAQMDLRPFTPQRLALEGFGHLSFSGLFNDQAGHLHARFKDTHGKEHTAQWDPARGDFDPGWNLSQSTAVTRQNGLPALIPDAAEMIHLDGGSVAQKDGQLLVRDPRTNAWSKGSEADLQDLHQGNDGFAYAVDKEGAVKRLAVQAQALSRTMGSGPDLSIGQGTEAKAGAALRGANDVVAEKIAVLNDDRYVTLSDGRLRVHDQKGTRQQLPSLPGQGQDETLGWLTDHEADQRHIEDLTIAGGDLYVLKGGAVFRMAAEHWQGGKSGVGVHQDDKAAWQLVDLPEGVAPQSIRTAASGELLVRQNGTEQHLSADGTLSAAPPAQRSRLTQNHDLHHRLSEREQTLGKLARHGNLKVGASVFGRANMETVRPRETAPTSLQYLKSHLRIGAALQKPVDKVNHANKGRAGLADVYRDEAQLLSRLADRGAFAPPAAASTDTLLTQIRAERQFSLNPKVALMTDVIEQATKTVVDDTERLLRSLAQDQGAVGMDGKVRDDYRPGKPVSQDMLGELARSLAASGVAGTPLNALMTQLQASHFQIGRRDPQAGRDTADAQALVKARLALNADVLSRLNSQLGVLSEMRKEQPADNLLDLMANQLEQTYAKGYVDRPLRKYTDAGFRSHRELEASYDASKTLLKYFRDDNHPMTQNLRVGMDVPREQIRDELSKALRQLKPRENLKISRNYAANINGGVSGPVADPVYMGGRVNIEPERTYGVTFTRYERGLKVAINRDGAISLGGNVGVGAGFSDHKAPKEDTTANLLQNSSWLGVSADLKYKSTQSNVMSFFIRDEDIDGFVDDLIKTPLEKSGEQAGAVAGRLHPLNFLDGSTEQELRTGSKRNYDVDLNAGAEYRVNKGQIGAQPVKGFMRFSVGAVGNANLASYESEQVQGRGSDGLRTDIRSDNRVRFLEKGGLTAYARLADAAFSAQPSGAFISGGIPTGFSVNVALDNKTGKAFDVRFKDSLPIQTREAKALASSLEKVFPLIEAPALDNQDARQQMALLSAAYDTPAQAAATLSGAQYAALNSLRQSLRQNQAADQHMRLMTTMDLTVKQSNVNRIDHASYGKRASDPTRAWLVGHTNPGNAEKVAAFMAKDPQLAGLIKELQGRKGTTRAEIKLEVTDTAKARIDEEAIAGRLNDDGLKRILSDQNNLRIKSISVFRTAGKEDSLTVPGVWLNYRSGSNLSVERLRGEITFNYARAQHEPVDFKLEGQLNGERKTPKITEMADPAGGGYRPV